MKNIAFHFIIFFLNIFIMKYVLAINLSYKFDYFPENCQLNTCYLKVKAKFPIKKNERELVLNLPYEPHMPEGLPESISDIKIKGANFEKINNYQLLLSNISGTKYIELSYNVKQKNPGIPNRSEDIYFPILQEKYFKFIGLPILIYPESIKKKHSHNLINFDFKWNLPDNWEFANSFGKQVYVQKVSSTLEEIQKSLFIGGSDYRFYEIKQSSREKIITAIQGKWQFTDEYFTNSVIDIINFQRKFMKQTQKEPYYLVELGLIQPKEVDLCKGYGGLNLTNAFSFFLEGNSCLLDEYSLKTLIHEYFHKWIPGKTFKTSEVKINNFNFIYSPFNWFREGFTNFFTSHIAFKMQYNKQPLEEKESIKKYLENFNRVIKSYYTSPYICYSQQRIKDEFWSNSSVQDLPYIQGELIAANWNAKIKKNTSNKNSLYDYIQNMISSKNTYTELNVINFAKNYPFHIDSVEEDIQEIHNGCEQTPIDEISSPIQIEPDVLGPCFEKKYKKYNILDKNRNLTQKEILVPEFQMTSDWDNQRTTCLDWFNLN